MRLLIGACKQIIKGNFINSVKRQKPKQLRKKWETFLKSNEPFYILKYKNLFKIKLYKDSELSQYIYQKKFEINESSFIKAFLKKGDNFIDIGANIGYFSLMASKIVGAMGNIFAFEPSKNNLIRLNENIKLNNFSNIKTIQKAVSNSIGELDLFISNDGYDAWNTFAKPFWFKNYSTEKTFTTTLDSFISELEISNLKLIKIDVEGWELNVLKGAENFLKTNIEVCLLIEFVEENLETAGISCIELYNYLSDLGYLLFKINKKGLNLEKKAENYRYENLIAAKDINVLKNNLKGWKIN
jgi:FkbM family methyltransferase